jgi:hypothetical protein
MLISRFFISSTSMRIVSGYIYYKVDFSFHNQTHMKINLNFPNTGDFVDYVRGFVSLVDRKELL